MHPDTVEEQVRTELLLTDAATFPQSADILRNRRLKVGIAFDAVLPEDVDTAED